MTTKSISAPLSPAAAGWQVEHVSPTTVRPSPLNPRKKFLQVRLVEMADSIRAMGVLEPLGCRRAEDGELELMYGERRYRGAMLVYQGYEDAAGVTHGPQPGLLIPVMVSGGGLSDQEVFERMMVENLEREDLSPSEEAAGYERMMVEFGLSAVQVAGRLKVALPRVQRALRLLELPNEALARVDSGELPRYVAAVALQVPAEWSGGEARMEALKIAEDAGNPQRARELIEARFLRPSREAALWMSAANEVRVAEVYGDAAEVLPYRDCRDLYPHGVTVLTPVTAGLYALASEVPVHPNVHFPVSLTWGEMASIYGAPRYVACDGAMRDAVLVRRDLVAEAARSEHTQELEVVPGEVAGYFWWRAEGPFVGLGDRLTLAKLTTRGDLPQGFAQGRIYYVVEAVLVDGLQYFQLSAAEGGPVLPIHGGLAEGCRVAGVDVTRCPFLPLEGRVALEAVRGAASVAEAAEEVLERARLALMMELVGGLEMAIRAEVSRGRGCEEMLARAIHFLAAAGETGFRGVDHPSARLMLLLERVDAPGATRFAGWAGLGVDQAGSESFAVCSWVLYYLERSEESDLRNCPTYKEAAAGYGV